MRLFAIVGMLVLCGALGWGFSTGADFGEFTKLVNTQPWMAVTVVDLYLGFAVFLAALWVFERSPGQLLVWGIPTLFLGNLVPLLYLALKGPKLLERL